MILVILALASIALYYFFICNDLHHQRLRHLANRQKAKHQNYMASLNSEKI
jgi:hypothetical protein